MNKIVKYISVSALGFLCACSLDSESKTESNDGNSYRTAADAEAAITGCYDGYQQTAQYGILNFQLLSEVMGDDCFGGAGTGDDGRYTIVDRFAKGSIDNLFAYNWKYYYTAIGRCNTLLSKIPGMSMTDAEKDNYEGEARFLRAMMYFELVRMFGNVPLVTAPTSDFVPQSDPDAVYAVIVDDLVKASKKITFAADKAWYAANDGRATAEAAKAMLARVYLFYTGYYQQSALPVAEELETVSKAEVVTGLNDIVSGGKFGLVNTRYSDLWATACYGNAESIAASTADAPALVNKSGYAWVGKACSNAAVNEFIFTLKFNSTAAADGNGFPYMVGFRDAANKSIIPYGKGWGACTVTPAAKDCFESGDERFAASIIDIDKEGFKDAFMSESLKQQKDYTGYYLKKYAPLSVYDAAADAAVPEATSTFLHPGNMGDAQYCQARDYVMIRYADVLLMLDELNENMTYTNSMIRPRAGLTKELGWSKENILLERRREFMGEGIRYWDVLRQGIDVAADMLAGTFDVQNGATPATVTISAANVKLTKGLCQIPQEQIGLSGNRYSQNAGW